MARYYRDGDWIMDSRDGGLVYDGLPGWAGDLVCELLEKIDFYKHRVPSPNRLVIEVDRIGRLGTVLQATAKAERPDDVVVIFVDKLLADYVSSYKSHVLPVEPLPVEPAAVGAAGGEGEG